MAFTDLAEAYVEECYTVLQVLLAMFIINFNFAKVLVVLFAQWKIFVQFSHDNLLINRFPNVVVHSAS